VEAYHAGTYKQRCDQVTGGGIVQETVIFSGTIVGERQRVHCKVQATKTTLDADSAVFSDYRIMDSEATDRLPDGGYELLANSESTRFRRNSGRFLSRPKLSD
jgi:hypothetical protein